MTTPTPTLPEALRLAEDLIQVHNGHADEGPSSFSEAAAELRRLHAQVEVLSAAQTELAAMRAGGAPVAEMVPCYTPSGKRVAVISRFQHLPIGTKLYAHPQPAAQDAEPDMFWDADNAGGKPLSETKSD